MQSFNQQPNQQRAISGQFVNTNRMLMKVYLLLAASLIFSGAVAAYAMIANVPALNPIFTIIIYLGLLFLTQAVSRTPFGIVAVFAFTGFMGLTLGPILNIYLHAYVNGSQLIMSALGGTGIIFVGLSAYAIMSKKDFNYLGGFLAIGIGGAFILSIINMFLLQLPVLGLVISAAFMLLMAGLILFQTSQIVRGGETNYIMATITLYIAILNLFLSLLRILSAFSGRN
jgi:modulator of FtsH protease